MATPSKHENLVKARVLPQIAVRFPAARGGWLGHHVKNPTKRLQVAPKVCFALREQGLAALPQLSEMTFVIASQLSSVRSIATSAYRNYP
jgi:hypothetical protein